MSDQIAPDAIKEKHTVEMSAAPKKTLLSDRNWDLQPILERLVADFCSRKTVFLDSGRRDFPKYGLSSEMALRTPIRLYDLPELSRQISTAFTDGSRVFMNADFFRRNLPDLIAGKISLDFVLAHELEHIRLLHVDRMKGMDHDVANIAADIRINIDILETFTATRLLSAANTEQEFSTVLDTKFVDGYRESIETHAGQLIHNACGTKVEDRAKWFGASSEQIARVLAAEKAARPKIDIKDLMRQAAKDMRSIADEIDKNAQNTPQNGAPQPLQGTPSPSNASPTPPTQDSSDPNDDSSTNAGSKDEGDDDSANEKTSDVTSSNQTGSDADAAGNPDDASGTPDGDATAGAEAASDENTTGSTPAQSGDQPGAGDDASGSPDDSAGADAQASAGDQASDQGSDPGDAHAGNDAPCSSGSQAGAGDPADGGGSNEDAPSQPSSQAGGQGGAGKGEGAPSASSQAGSSASTGGASGPNSGGTPSGSGSPSASSGAPSPGTDGTPSASDLRAVADAMDRVANGTHSKDDLETIRDTMGDLIGSSELNNADATHVPKNDVPKEVEDLPPSVRSQMAGAAADQMLNPSAGNEQGPGQGQGDGDAMNPSNYQAPGDRHYVAPEDLKDILDRAGAQDLSKALGYDTPEAIAKNRRDAAKNAESAVRNAAEDVRQSKGSYPGAHRVHSAMRDLQEFNKPVLNWKLHIKRVLAQSSSRGRKTHYSVMDPWIGYTVPHGDMGFSSASDVPYMGSHIPAKPKKNLIVALLDTSGSTSGILVRIVSEAVNLARKNKHDNTPEVVLIFADTVARGKPLLINEQSLKKLLASGVDVHGGGGTDFLAPLLGVMKATERGGLFHGKKIDHILYFTDGECWLPSRDNLPKEMPPVSFIVPDSHYRLEFDRDVKASKWAHVEWFSPEEANKEIDLSRRRGMRM